MSPHIRGRVWLPVHKLIAAVVSLVVLAGAITLTASLTDDGGDPCGEGLRETGKAKECVGVSDGGHIFDKRLAGLIDSIKKENDDVREGWEASKDGKPKTPYVRIALMMPMTHDASSAMTTELIRNGLVGAHTAQRRANKDSGLRYQLLLANVGKDLNHWQPVVDELGGMTKGEAPLVGVTGLSSSTPETQKAVNALAGEHGKDIPVVAPVITSTGMKAPRLFKTSASNEHFALALKRYLAAQPGSDNGVLVSDTREQDSYAQDLRRVFKTHFGKDYHLSQGGEATYLGETGEDAGMTKLFEPAAKKICDREADTVFFAGRDHDLPALVSDLAEHQPTCESRASAKDKKRTVRIIKVGIGRDPVFTDKDVKEDMEEAHVTIVGGSDVDPRWWAPGSSGTTQPRGFASFHKEYENLDRERKLKLKENALDDGYAIMYHDAFKALTDAADVSYIGDKDDDGSAPSVHIKDDVYQALLNKSPLGTQNGTSCDDCVQGASGTFGFNDDSDLDRWPVCKPVPVIEYPERGDGGQPYRTHEDIFKHGCR